MTSCRYAHRSVAKTSAQVSAGRLLQRKCACGSGASALSDDCADCAAKRLQKKLTLGAASDPLEREADRIAEQVTTTRTSHQPQAVRASPVRVQKVGGTGSTAGATVPQSVEHTISSSGRALDPIVRADMEGRFGHDFSRVRVHTDSSAQRSARDVDALAYTVGDHLVFSAGAYAPGTAAGQRVLAHELTHVLQQAEGVHRLQRWASCNPPRMSLLDCPPREEGERHRARTGGMPLLELVGQGWFVANFDIGKANVKRGLRRLDYWRQLLDLMASEPGSQWRLLGFTDCEGGEARNQQLRLDRAKAIYDILPARVRTHVAGYEAAPIGECVTENDTSSDRAQNRSVALVRELSVADMDGEDLTGTLPRKEPESEDCSDEQRDRLAIAFAAAEDMLDEAISSINRLERGSDDEALLERYFGDSAFEERFSIKQGFTTTRRQWQKKSGKNPTYPYVCRKTGSGQCVDNSSHVIYGYVEWRSFYGKGLWPIDNINICEAAFGLDNFDLAATLIHESSHRLDATSEDIYCKNDRCSSLDTYTAIDNADSYAQYARERFERTR